MSSAIQVLSNGVETDKKGAINFCLSQFVIHIAEGGFVSLDVSFSFLDSLISHFNIHFKFAIVLLLKRCFVYH